MDISTDTDDLTSLEEDSAPAGKKRKHAAWRRSAWFSRIKKLGFWLEKTLAAWFSRQLDKTLKFTIKGMPAQDYRCIFAFWHRNMLILMIHRKFCGIAVMVSTSDAGEVIAGPLSKLGFIPVRGSTTRKGSRALKQLIQLSREHSLAITPDGPFGPRGTIQPGVFQLAYLAKVPIVPVTVECEKEWVFKSWDRTRLPKPFSRVHVTYGEPIWVTDREQFPAQEEKLRLSLTDMV